MSKHKLLSEDHFSLGEKIIDIVRDGKPMSLLEIILALESRPIISIVKETTDLIEKGVVILDQDNRLTVLTD